MFRIPKPSIPDATSKIPRFRNPDSLALWTPFLCSLRSRRLAEVGAKRERARDRETRVSPSRPLLRRLLPLPHASPSITSQP